MLNIQFLENEPSEICSHLSEKLSKGRFFAPDKIENHTSEGKGQEKKKWRGRRKEERRKKKKWFFILEIVFGGQETV